MDISIVTLSPLLPSVLGKAWSTCGCQDSTSLVPMGRQMHAFAFMGLSFILFWCAAFLFSTLLLLSFHPRLLWTHSVWLGLNVFPSWKPLRPVFWLYFSFPHRRCLFIYCSLKTKLDEVILTRAALFLSPLSFPWCCPACHPALRRWLLIC